CKEMSPTFAYDKHRRHFLNVGERYFAPTFLYIYKSKELKGLFPEHFPVGFWRIPCDRFERFVKAHKIVESRFIAGLFYGTMRIPQNLLCIGYPEFRYEVR